MGKIFGGIGMANLELSGEARQRFRRVREPGALRTLHLPVRPGGRDLAREEV